jgi:RNA polymerase sigma factor (sigma-70 family)
MLVEDPQICRQLQKVVARLAHDPALREDLLQEELLHLWQVECQCPGRTRSWYIQNCRFCASHWLAAGRSIDSPKRSTGSNRVAIDETESQCAPMEIPVEDDVLDTVIYDDLQEVLSRHLTPRERAVLKGLADGLRLREIALQLKLSYPTALKDRRRIAALVSKLEFPKCLELGRQGSARVPSGNKDSGARA